MRAADSSNYLTVEMLLGRGGIVSSELSSVMGHQSSNESNEYGSERRKVALVVMMYSL
jgi:hypothetical protein